MPTNKQILNTILTNDSDLIWEIARLKRERKKGIENLPLAGKLAFLKKWESEEFKQKRKQKISRQSN